MNAAELVLLAGRSAVPLACPAWQIVSTVQLAYPTEAELGEQVAGLRRAGYITRAEAAAERAAASRLRGSLVARATEHAFFCDRKHTVSPQECGFCNRPRRPV